MKLTYMVDRKKKAYNKAMRNRAKVNHSAGKAPINHKEPQIRKASTKVNKGDEFTKISNRDRRK